jgi:serine/threonine protein kinase
MKILKSEGNFHNDMPSIIRELLIGGTCSQRSRIVQFVKNASYGIVNKIGDCTLNDLIQRKLTIDEARMISYKILVKLNNIHQMGFMHRDIKPENILLHFTDSGLDIEIIDYGLSSPSEKNDDSNVTSLWWRSPEVIMGLNHTPK